MMTGADDSTEITRAPMIEAEDPLAWRLTVYALVGGFVFLFGFVAYYGALAFLERPGVYLKHAGWFVGSTTAMVGAGYITVRTFKGVMARVA